ncbi:MAG: sigma-70 family RNA polymerase sigma factor, partial [Bacteroidota bacterium]
YECTPLLSIKNKKLVTPRRLGCITSKSHGNMTQQNPFSRKFDSQKDNQLIKKAITGNRQALNELLQRHNNFIYNIAIKMLANIEDAKDVTQDILIKVVTNLAKYDVNKAQFRTWLYRITFNYILNYKKSNTEKNIVSFQHFFEFMENVEDDHSIMDDEAVDQLSEEMKLKCMSGMLMCIPREDRLLYIMGDLFKIDHHLGAEVFEISKVNFRKRLSRTRNQLRQWMDNKCGLVHKSNPCRCAKKTKGFIKRGIVDPESLVWDKAFTSRINTYTEENLQDALKSSDMIYSKLYREHPFKENNKTKEIIEEILSDKNFAEILNL